MARIILFERSRGDLVMGRGKTNSLLGIDPVRGIDNRKVERSQTARHAKGGV
jgi:hypothetical protein